MGLSKLEYESLVAAGATACREGAHISECFAEIEKTLPPSDFEETYFEAVYAWEKGFREAAPYQWYIRVDLCGKYHICGVQYIVESDEAKEWVQEFVYPSDPSTENDCEYTLEVQPNFNMFF